MATMFFPLNIFNSFGYFLLLLLFKFTNSAVEKILVYSSMNFNTCIDSCDHHKSQDIEKLLHLKKLPTAAPLQVESS